MNTNKYKLLIATKEKLVIGAHWSLVRIGHSQGFTLIEIIMSVGIMGLLFTAAIALFFNVQKTSGQAGSITDVDKNSQVILNTLDRFIKNAQSVDTPCPGTYESLTVTNQDGQQTTFELTEDDLGNTSIASNGAVINSPQVTVHDLVFDCTITRGAPPQITLNFQIDLVNAKKGITIANKYFLLTSGLRSHL